MKRKFWTLSLLLPLVLISADIRAEYSLLLTSEKGGPCFFVGGMQYSLEDGIAILKGRIDQDPCEIKFIRDLPVGVVVDVMELLKKNGIRSPKWLVIDGKGVRPYKILSIEVIAEKPREVEEISIDEIVGGKNADKEISDVGLRSEWVVKTKQVLEEKIKQILPVDYETKGVSYSPPSSRPIITGQYGCYICAITQKGVEYFPDAVNRWPVVIVFHPSFEISPKEKCALFLEGQQILRTPSVALYVCGQLYKNWPSMTNDLAKALSGDLGLTWKSSDTGK